jgi:excisionase family DNA binding protein
MKTKLPSLPEIDNRLDALKAEWAELAILRRAARARSRIAQHAAQEHTASSRSERHEGGAMNGDSAMTPRLLLTPREAAAALGISVRHLFTLTRRDGLPSLLLGTSRRYRPADVERWIAERAGGVSSEFFAEPVPGG